MAPITSRIGNDPYLDRREGTVLFRGELHVSRQLMARRGGDELFFAGELPFDRTTDLEDREHTQILGDHFLFTAKTTAYPFGKNVKLVGGEPKDVSKLLLDDERSLGTGANMNAAVFTFPRDRAVRLQ